MAPSVRLNTLGVRSILLGNKGPIALTRVMEPF